MFSVEKVLNLNAEEQNKLVSTFSRDNVKDFADFVTYLTKLKLLKEKVVDSGILRKILYLSREELLHGLEESGLNTNVTVGEAIFSLYKMARGIKADGRVIIRTHQTFYADRKSLSPDSLLSTLALEEKEIEVPEDVMDSLVVETYIGMSAPWNRIFINNLLAEKSLSTLDLGNPEDFYQGYLEACLLEDDMRKNMYITEDPKYNQKYYGLQEVTAGFIESLPSGNRKPRHENAPKFSDNLLFPYQSAVPRRKELKERITDFFDFILEGEEHLFIAGGSVASTLFQSTTGDVDLFVHGTDEEEALNIVRRVVEKLIPKQVLRTKNSITLINCPIPEEHHIDHFFRRYDTFKVQIILRLYKTPSEILHGFDVDSCCVGYDGKFWATERAVHSFKHSTNTVNFGRLSPSYESRLAKYATRGFGVYVPNLDGTRVDRKLLEKEYKWRISDFRQNEPKGLSYLLFYNEKADPDSLKDNGKPDKRTFKRETELTAEEKSDYAPYFTTGITLGTLVVSFEDEDLAVPNSYKDVYINSIYNDVLDKRDARVTFIKATPNKLEEILNIDERVLEMLRNLSQQIVFVLPFKTEWKTTNPGEQMTNTFHQIILRDNKKWYKGRYYH